MKKMTKQLLVLLAFSVTLASVGYAGGPAQRGEAKKAVSVVKKYPPYPDVWNWVIPYPQRATPYFEADRQADGDVRISYKLKSKKLKKPNEDLPEGGSYGITFFGRQLVVPRRDVEPFGLHRSRRVTLAGGKILQSLDDVIRESKGCFERADRSFLLSDADGKAITQTYLLYVLGKPRRFTVREGCHDGTDFTYQVETISANLVPLEDGTFLVVDGEHGLVIRFDEQFKTKSSLLNQRVFVVDMDSFWRAKDYGSREEGNRDWQRFEDDLYSHVMSLKGRK